MTYEKDSWDGYYGAIDRNLTASGAFHHLISRYVREAARVLEFGTGTGANIPFLVGHFKCVYFGVEGSRVAWEGVLERFPTLRGHIYNGDFTHGRPFKAPFDLVIDRASVAHNDLEGIRRALKIAWDMLAPGGLMISSDWFSRSHSEAYGGIEVEPWTKTGYEDGQFFGVGKVHFSDEAEIVELFKDFEGIALEERVVRRAGPNALVEQMVYWPWISGEFRDKEYSVGVWDIIVRKPR